MNILFLNKFNEYWDKQYEKLKMEFPGVEFVNTYDPNDREEALKNADIVIAGRLSADEIEKSPNIKAIIVPFTGLNNFPAEVINKKKIKLFNTHANAPYVAEHAVSMAMALLGRVIPFHSDLSKGIWNRSIEDDDMWISMRNQSAGILGYGHIGREIAKYLQVFNCRVTGFKRNPEKTHDEYTGEITNSIDELINKSEIIFNVLPLTQSTKGIINAGVLERMQSKFYITIGRGATTDEEALYNALKNNILAGAAIDVWYNYPGKSEDPVMPSNFPFWELPNVLLSPHKSSHTTEAVKAMIDDTCANVRKVISLSV